MTEHSAPIPQPALERLRLAKAQAEQAQARYAELAQMAALGMGLDPDEAQLVLKLEDGAFLVCTPDQEDGASPGQPVEPNGDGDH